MSNKTVTVIASMTAKEGMENETRTMLAALLPSSRKDDGCINYHLHEEIDKPGHFWFIEQWASMENLEAHLKTPPLTNLVAQKDKYLTSMIVNTCSTVD